MLEVGAQIESSVAAIELNARRQMGSTDLITAGIENATTDLSEIGRYATETAEETAGCWR